MDGNLVNSYIPFTLPLSIVCAGPTMSGKSSFIKELLKNRDVMFTEKIDRIMYVYDVWNLLYEDIEKNVPNITFTNSIPSREEVDLFAPEGGGQKLIIFDDQVSKMKKCKHFSDFFMILCNNRKLSCILTVQNIYSKEPGMRDISLNTRALVLFKNMRSHDQILVLARQIHPQNTKYFLDAFEKATTVPHAYLVVDLNPCIDQRFHLRSNVLPSEEGPAVCYLPKN